MKDQYFEHADELAQEVVNAWGANVQAGNADFLTIEFKVLVEKTCHYRDMRRVADNRREFNILSEQEEAEEKTARQAFVEAYKALHERHAITS